MFILTHVINSSFESETGLVMKRPSQIVRSLTRIRTGDLERGHFRRTHSVPS